MSSSPRSVRLDDAVIDRLNRHARNTRTSTSALMERLLDEALRQADHPAITFRDGPAGRRAGLFDGPDVWEVIAGVRQIRVDLSHDMSSDDVVEATAEATGITARAVRDAVRYYVEFSDEIDDLIDANAREADRLERLWLKEREVIGPAAS
jgi:predicted transcriptional regulator